MKIASILATTAIVLAATASQSAEASVGKVTLHGGKDNAAGTGDVHAADRQQLADFLHSNHETGPNFALVLSQWLRDRAAAPPSKRSSHQQPKHKQPASQSESDSDSGSGSAIDAHQAGHPHHHPHKQHSNKQHNHKKHGHKKHSHKKHHSRHSASASGSGSDSAGFLAEVANPHPHHRGKPASILHLDNKDKQPSLHENADLHERAELHLASGSSSSSSSVDVDVDSEDSEDSEDIVFPSHGDEDADDSVDSFDSASSLPSAHGDVDAAGSPASTPAVETPVLESPSSSNDDESVVIKPHLPNLRHSDTVSSGDEGKSAAVTSLAEGNQIKNSPGEGFSAGHGTVVGAACVVAGLVGVIAAAVGFRRVRRSDARYGASELIVDLPDPESVGDDEQEEEARDDAASALADAPASTTNALDEAELHEMQSPFPRADEVGEFTNA